MVRLRLVSMNLAASPVGNRLAHRERADRVLHAARLQHRLAVTSWASAESPIVSPCRSPYETLKLREPIMSASVVLGSGAFRNPHILGAPSVWSPTWSERDLVHEDKGAGRSRACPFIAISARATASRAGSAISVRLRPECFAT
jgi:hypothetical protein